MRALWMLAVGCVALASACDREASLCRERMASAQAIVSAVDPKSEASVQASVTAVEEARLSCERAKLGAERELLQNAKNQLTAQLGLLETRAKRKRVTAPTAEDLERLAKQGDPGCPKGQAYKPRNGPKEIRCTGPQIVDMGSEALEAYFGERRFKVTKREQPPELRAELGSELYVFAFEQLGERAPRCVTAYAPPSVSWQELTAKLTGVAPEKLVLDGPVVRSSRGELPLRVEHPNDQPTVHLGSCGAP